MKLIIKYKEIINIIYLFLIAFCVITIFSQNSFLYYFNDSPDINYMLNVGKQILNGHTLYTESFEQKGPYCMAIYTFANIFGPYKYLALYFLEIITAFFSFIFLYKIILVKGCRYPGVLIPIAAFLVYGSRVFVYGGSFMEEWALPYYMYAYYIMVRHIYFNNNISTKNLIVIGLTSGILFFSKFTLISFYIGWFLYYLIKDKFIAIKAIPKIALGVFISAIPVLYYFTFHNAINDFINTYFLLNLTYKESIQITNIVRNLNILWTTLGLQIILLLCGLLNKNNKERILIIIILCIIFLINFALKQIYIYYAFILFALLPVMVSTVYSIIDYIKNKNLQCIAIIGLYLISIRFAYLYSPNIYKIRDSSADMYIDEAYSYINEFSETPTILGLNIDVSPYFAYTDTFPDEKYFCKININTEEYINYFVEKIVNQSTDYIIFAAAYQNESNGLEQYGYSLKRQYSYHDADGDKWFCIYSKF